ncbi:hypothetical protein MGG_15863 [Pyricularia oryzae 70-15]|uniref:Uncharacterized protein n=1 Tax=Pyricularia oryzae (strain 70-15 / ATCC MYA-4617 / FGSC 8958) TaxID=242507 RepID=G4MT65_PYRO7|nr:uncharacterized protein MGG_15863 [Pyricularia oryzae 70-15]EHA55530.1 hypothetical protein MGG_15863 [Pyricularia oryzae 70-15]
MAGDASMQSASGNEKRKWDHTKVAKHERDFDAVGKGTTADPPSLLRLAGMAQGGLLYRLQ